LSVLGIELERDRSRLRRIIFGVIAAALAALITGACLAADGPDAATQQFLRQQERERALQQQQEKTPDVRLERGAQVDLGRLPTGESPCFTINRIELIGEASERFQWALQAANESNDPALGRCLGSGGINLVMKRVQNAIIERGYITTRVLAHPQDLNSGTLTLTLIPGRVHSIRFADGASLRATKWNAVPASPGDLLNLRDIEQALENFKRIPTAEADIQIEPAAGADARLGDSDIVIAWQQAFPLRLNLSADDSGTKATGKYQGSVTVSYDDWFTLNDLFYASFNHDLDGHGGTRGSRGYTVHYSVPFGYWLLGLTTNSYYYHQSVAGINQTYIYSGESENSDVRLSRLIYRDAVRKTSVSLRGWLRTSNNYIDDTEVEVQRRRMAGWELGVAHREFMRLAVLDVSLAYRMGTGALDSLRAPEEDFGEGTAQPKLFTADAQISVPFIIAAQQLRYIGVVRGQWNQTPLVPQDRFAIGGRYSVRGFDGENVLLAERGWLIRNDIGIALGRTGQELYVGVDYGEVGGASSEFLLGDRLAGAVIGVRGAYKGMSYDVFVGQPIVKPTGFITASTTAGFNLNWAF
jgi:hemolysin activation/secretion protein